MTTWQPQECLRLSGAAHAEVTALGKCLWGCVEQAAEAQHQGVLRGHILPPGCPHTPCAMWIPGVLRRADEAHEASPSLLVVETAHN